MYVCVSLNFKGVYHAKMEEGPQYSVHKYFTRDIQITVILTEGHIVMVRGEKAC